MTEEPAVEYTEADRAMVNAVSNFAGLPGLTTQEERFVMLHLKGMSPDAAAQAAGYNGEKAGSALLRKSAVKKALKALRQHSFYDVKVTREKLTQMLFEAHSHAANASEEIMAIRELGKMHGQYEAAKLKVEGEVTHKITNERQLERLSDAELARLAGQKPHFNPEDAIDGDYTEVDQ